MERIIEGNMHVFGHNIDTDQIYPGQYLDVTDHKEMASHCMQGASESFAREFKPGDVLVAGRNFGCGSSRENAAIALKVSGVSCILAESFARIFFRNAINMGLPLLVCQDLSSISEHGAPIKVDLAANKAVNMRTMREAALEPISEYAMNILEAGGIKPLMLKETE